MKKAPFGYRFDFVEGRYKVIPDEAKKIHVIFELAGDWNLSGQLIARILNTMK